MGVGKIKAGKIKAGIFMLSVMAMVTFVACDEDAKKAVKEHESAEMAVNNSDVQVEQVSGELTREEVENVQPEDEELLQIAELPEEKTQVEIFYGNEDGDGIISEIMNMEPVTATKIIGELAKKNIVSADTKVLGLTKQTQNGKIRLKLNMSKEFQEYVSMMGTSGEYIVVGSLVNSFLKAYNAEDVLILIEGELFETGHQSYENYLQFYQQSN